MITNHTFSSIFLVSLLVFASVFSVHGAEGEFGRFLDCFKALDNLTPGCPSLGCLSGEPPIAGIGFSHRLFQQKERQGFYVVTEKTAYFVPENLPPKPVSPYIKQIYRLNIPGRKPTLFGQVPKEANPMGPFPRETDLVVGVSTLPQETQVLDVDLTGKERDTIDDEMRDVLSKTLISRWTVVLGQLAEPPSVRARLTATEEKKYGDQVSQLIVARDELEHARKELTEKHKMREASRAKINSGSRTSKQDIQELMESIDQEDKARDHWQVLTEKWEGLRLDNPEPYAVFLKALSRKPPMSDTERKHRSELLARIKPTIEICKKWDGISRPVSFPIGKTVTIELMIEKIKERLGTLGSEMTSERNTKVRVENH